MLAVNIAKLAQRLRELGVGFDMEAMRDRGVLKLVPIEGLEAKPLSDKQKAWLKEHKPGIIAALSLPHYESKDMDMSVCAEPGCTGPVYVYIRAFIDFKPGLAPLCEVHYAELHEAKRRVPEVQEAEEPGREPLP